MSNFNSADITEFISEAQELLETAESDLLKAEKGEATNFYNSVFRAFHSIKGGAGMLGMPALQEHMHKIESLWGALKGKERPSKEESEYFLLAIDCSKKLLQGEKVEFNYQPLAPSNSPSKQQYIPSSPTIRETPITTVNLKNEKSQKTLAYAVDDEPEILEIIKDVLEDDGFHVQTFTEPKLLYEAVHKSIPDFIITDFKMPNESGLDVLKTVKKLDPEIPVILLSGFLTKDVLLSSIKEGGFFSVLEKPFKEMDLLKECWSASRHHEIQRLIKRSLHLLVYQFSDLEEYLKTQGKEEIAQTIGNELKTLLSKHRKIF